MLVIEYDPDNNNMTMLGVYMGGEM